MSTKTTVLSTVVVIYDQCVLLVEECVPPTLPGGCRGHHAPAAAVWTAPPVAHCQGHGSPWAGVHAWASDPTAEQHRGWGFHCEGRREWQGSVEDKEKLFSQHNNDKYYKIQQKELLENIKMPYFICYILRKGLIFLKHWSQCKKIINKQNSMSTGI